jgi:hypothetical protein
MACHSWLLRFLHRQQSLTPWKPPQNTFRASDSRWSLPPPLQMYTLFGLHIMRLLQWLVTLRPRRKVLLGAHITAITAPSAMSQSLHSPLSTVPPSTSRALLSSRASANIDSIDIASLRPVTPVGRHNDFGHPVHSQSLKGRIRTSKTATR